MKLCLHNGTLLNGFSQMDKCALLINDGKIEDVFSEERFKQHKFSDEDILLDVHGAYIAPGMIDTHIHGFKGHGTDECTTEGILQMSADLAEYGVTAFNPTMYPSSEESMIKTIKAIVKAMGHEKGAHIMGIHLEGPFISPNKLGVQRPETVKAVDLALMERLWEASEGHIVNMTVAPEIKDMRRLALNCLQKGIVLQAGHTDAAYKNMVEGMQAGIFHATHMFNAMSQLHHRNPGAVGAVLTHAEMTCEIIADGVHVHKDLFKLLQKDKTPDQIVLITDALTPTEQFGDNLVANGEAVEFVDGCFHRKADGVIAGS
ncbi:MAG: N-acetylglucosamine-6-phosphate deacetylase, partial [Treponema sp.]|nr:N-acetylglucosamine-6-phosphate deacetylase [Treponema sp.]